MKELSLPATVFTGKLGHDVAALTERAKSSSRWRRLLSLVMLAGSFDRYMFSVCSIAIASDPVLSPGFPKVVDGALIKKLQVSLPRRDIRGLTVGDWNQRVALYKSLFSEIPNDLNSALSDLDYLRRSRNRVAHALGVDDGYDEQAQVTAEPILDIVLGSTNPAQLKNVQISEDRLIKLTGTLQRTVDAVDKHLMSQFIGSYEVIDLYLEWTANKQKFEERAGIVLDNYSKHNKTMRFRKVLGQLFGTTPGTEYVANLEDYVSNKL